MAKVPVVFFGSGPVAAQSLKLLMTDFEVVAVVTKPKPAHHHGLFPVIDLAEQHHLPLHLVSNKQELSALIATKPFKTEAAILIDFGIIVSQDVIDYFPKGIINSHFSLLPEWRGADPITFAILSGQKQTGVSLMLLVQAMDEGPLLGFGIQELSGQETTPELTDRLIRLSDSLLKEMLPSYISGTPFPKTGKEIRARSQEDVSNMMHKPYRPTYSRKLTKTDGELDFTKPAEVLEREIRAYIEWPKSHAKLASIDVIITSAKVVSGESRPGQIQVKDKSLLIYCGEDTLDVLELKPAGKQTMTASAFIAGYGNKLS